MISPSTSTVSKSKDDDAFILLNDRRLSSGSSPPSNQQDVGAMVWAMARQTNAKPGHVERLKSDASSESESSSHRTIEDRLKSQKDDNTRQVQQLQKTLSSEENQQIDDECLQRFIKLNVRLMTDDHVRVSYSTCHSLWNTEIRSNKRISCLSFLLVILEECCRNIACHSQCCYVRS